MSLSSWEMQLVETAQEELEILQTQYPNRFAYLKSDLESFISDLREVHAPPCASSSSSSSSLVVLTQESSNCKIKNHHKKRKCTKEKFGDQESSSSSSTGKIDKNMMSHRVVTKREDRVELVLERAQLCLQKIRDVKASLC
ncbi:unnamed protein product [Cochlearia groenlandica]